MFAKQFADQCSVLNILRYAVWQESVKTACITPVTNEASIFEFHQCDVILCVQLRIHLRMHVGPIRVIGVHVLATCTRVAAIIVVCRHFMFLT